MLNQIKNVCSWVVSQVQAGVIWVRDNWPGIQTKADATFRWAYEVAINQVRRVVVAFERGIVIGIENVEKRQAMSFKEALAEAKSVVKAMSDEQVCAYAAHWFCQSAAQVCRNLIAVEGDKASMTLGRVVEVFLLDDPVMFNDEEKKIKVGLPGRPKAPGSQIHAVNRLRRRI